MQGESLLLPLIFYKQTFQIVNIYGHNKPYQREKFFQSLTILLTPKIPLLEETSIW